jgi:hypothetical protein
VLKHRKCFCSRIYVCNSAHADHYRYNRLIETFQELVNCHLGGCRIGLAKTVNISEWTGSCALSRVRNIVLIEYGCLNHPFRFFWMFSVTVVVENSSIRKGREVRLLACFERERLSGALVAADFATLQTHPSHSVSLSFGYVDFAHGLDSLSFVIS